MERLRNLISRIPTGVMSGVTVAIILWLTLAPHPVGEMDFPLFAGADKVVHGIIFAFLTFIILLDTMKQRKWQMLTLTTIAVVAFACALFGIGIELLQRTMGLGRTFEMLDILADTGGAMGAAGIWAMIQKAFAKP